MIVDGDDAKHCDAVRLDNLVTVNKGPLVSANEDTGYVSWSEPSKGKQIVTIGKGTIRIVRKTLRGSS